MHDGNDMSAKCGYFAKTSSRESRDEAMISDRVSGNKVCWEWVERELVKEKSPSPSRNNFEVIFLLRFGSTRESQRVTR
jgi:hypothetical protein